MPPWFEVVNSFLPRGSKVAKRHQKPDSIHDRDRIIVRLPDGMRDKIAAMAVANGRSMTAEVIAALEQHLKGPDRTTQLSEQSEKHREEILHIWNAIENIEWHLERQIGAPLGAIRAARRAAEKGES
jgi:hypothetical protein